MFGFFCLIRSSLKWIDRGNLHFHVESRLAALCLLCLAALVGPKCHLQKVLWDKLGLTLAIIQLCIVPGVCGRTTFCRLRGVTFLHVIFLTLLIIIDSLLTCQNLSAALSESYSKPLPFAFFESRNCCRISRLKCAVGRCESALVLPSPTCEILWTLRARPEARISMDKLGWLTHVDTCWHALSPFHWTLVY